MVDWLTRTGQFHIRPSLAGIGRVLARLKDPQERCQVIMVGGTNGKGVCAHHIANLLRCHGARVGLFTSPHLNSVRERFVIDGTHISRSRLSGSFTRVIEAADECGVELTYFEALTASAYHHFHRERLDWVIMEVGMGGTWDAVNVTSPMGSVITTVALDHTEHLGRSMVEIASTKADILHPGTLGVTAARGRALAPIIERAKEVAARLLVAGKELQVSDPRLLVTDGIPSGSEFELTTPFHHYPRLALRLPGEHQAMAAALAVVMVEGLLGQEYDPVKTMAALDGPGPPGRWEVMPGEPPFILDGAHNPQAMAALAGVLREVTVPVVAVVGQMADKAPETLLPLTGVADHIVCTTVGGPRALNPGQVADRLRPHCESLSMVTGVNEALEEATRQAREMGGMVCVTGSFYLVGRAREVLGMVDDSLRDPDGE